MSHRNDQLNWLRSRSEGLLSEIDELAVSSSDPVLADALDKITELMRINQQIQSVLSIHLLTSLKQSEMEIDDQLNEIAGYMESILVTRQREAENLRKIQ